MSGQPDPIEFEPDPDQFRQADMFIVARELVEPDDDNPNGLPEDVLHGLVRRVSFRADTGAIPGGVEVTFRCMDHDTWGRYDVVLFATPEAAARLVERIQAELEKWASE